ncbi:NUDIX domain-containing protein [Kitasatospora sp. NPDC056138]|uniref:NUDIX hydrolase n=1 Tax=Kitasatospora sp. NPDC056138 TaxID=3345724 RepID=UPI0035D71FE7
MIPDHIAALRAKVGSEVVLQIPGINAVVVGPEGVLLQRSAETLEWSLLSGILDPGEEPAAGVVREVYEETGVWVVPERLAAVTVSGVVTHKNGDQAQYLELVFRCRPVSGEARVNDDESLEVAWFPVDALPAMAARMRERIDLALKNEPEAWFRAVEVPAV